MRISEFPNSGEIPPGTVPHGVDPNTPHSGDGFPHSRAAVPEDSSEVERSDLAGSGPANVADRVQPPILSGDGGGSQLGEDRSSDRPLEDDMVRVIGSRSASPLWPPLKQDWEYEPAEVDPGLGSEPASRVSPARRVEADILAHALEEGDTAVAAVASMIDWLSILTPQPHNAALLIKLRQAVEEIRELQNLRRVSP